MAKDEARISAADVEKEHLGEVRAGVQAAYLLAVLIGGFLLMIALIALLGASP